MTTQTPLRPDKNVIVPAIINPDRAYTSRMER
jgi:hypothetical protein